MGHCEVCERYEQAILDAGARGEPAPTDVAPCKQYEMSQAFREFLLGRMRQDVANQVSASGLNRMAVVKAPDSKQASSASKQRSK